MLLREVSLEDRYTRVHGEVIMSGIQALVRLPMLQREIDLASGLNTAGFISGYRGSPLGGYDQALWKATKFLQDHHIVFRPGINEDLAATAVWGSQQTCLHPENMKYDGIFGIWYGKGPGIDRSCDAFKHANAAGTDPKGGVLLLMGDDHGCKSSTLPHQSEQALMSCFIPILNPAGVEDIIDMGLFGFALSRYCGLWVGFKTITETVDSSSTFNIDLAKYKFETPLDFRLPVGGLNIRWPDVALEQEKRILDYRLPAAQAFVRANKIDKEVIAAPKRKIGIITTGKSYLDVRQALKWLELTDEQAADFGISLYKVGMSWPLEPQGIEEFAKNHKLLVIVEEKRGIIEDQVKQILYGMKDTARPVIYGKADKEGQPFLSSAGELSPWEIAIKLGTVLADYTIVPNVQGHVDYLQSLAFKPGKNHEFVDRKPFFCSGCPHNTSTKLPEGSRALAGIGCHYMTIWMPERHAETYTQMGGEGVPWIGQTDFTKEKHVFANLGDGTYYHSGLLAIRASVAADVNITYKILYNDAVAMTGGQPVDGPISVSEIASQCYHEGVKKIIVMSDDIEKYKTAGKGSPLKMDVPVEFYQRDDLDKVQKKLRDYAGVSVLIYEQTCAAEKRRRRKRGLLEDPQKRVVINQQVCEGCGDCSLKSNCLSVTPVETEFGRKRQIDQSSCNKDYSCLKGFCPSFVTVYGGKLKAPDKRFFQDYDTSTLPDPKLPSIDDSAYSILVTGIGGTGVVTIGAILGMAVHMEGNACSMIDQAGLAQKGGAVTTHLKIAKRHDQIFASRISIGETDLLLGCDKVVSASADILQRLCPQHSHVVINQDITMTSDFTKNPDFSISDQGLLKQIVNRCGDKKFVHEFGATHVAAKLIGNTIEANLMMLGFAYQKGLVPVTHQAIEKAIEMNNVSVDKNKLSFLIGRIAAETPDFIAEKLNQLSKGLELDFQRKSETLEEMVLRRMSDLKNYQNEALSETYASLVDRVRTAEETLGKKDLEMTQAVAKYYYKLLAYKDEYEVARLYTNGNFKKYLEQTFEGNYKLEFNLAPPLIADKDSETGHLKKKTFGPWMLSAFSVLAKLKFLRGTAFDIFGYSAERKAERGLIKHYEQLIDRLLPLLNDENYILMLQLVSLPEEIRGYGHVKEEHLKGVKLREEKLMAHIFDPAADKELSQSAEGHLRHAS